MILALSTLHLYVRQSGMILAFSTQHLDVRQWGVICLDDKLLAVEIHLEFLDSVDYGKTLAFDDGVVLFTLQQFSCWPMQQGSCHPHTVEVTRRLHQYLTHLSRG